MTSNLLDSVVLITSSSPGVVSFGTGFPIYCDEQGTYIVTCAHVVTAVGRENVKVEGMAAEVVARGSEADNDLAVLRVKGLQKISLLPLGLAAKIGSDFITAGFQSYNKKYKTCVGTSLQGKLVRHYIIVAIDQEGQFFRTNAWALEITDDYELEEGYSGSPVEVDGNIIAVVSTKQGGRKGVAISVEALKNIPSEMPSSLLKENIWSEMPSSLLKEAEPAKRQETTATPSVYRGHTSPVCKLVWSPDSMYVASVSREQTVRIWNDVTGMIYQTYHGHRGPVNTVAWSPDGTCIVSGDANSIIYVWDTTTGKMISSLRSSVADAVNDAAWSPASRIAVARASNIAQIYDLHLRECAPRYAGHSSGIGALNGVLEVAWSTDGTRVASSGWDKTVRVWDPSTGTTICTYHGHGEQVINDLSWSPKGTRLATAGSDGTIQVWNAPDESPLLTYCMQSSRYVTGVCWSPDGTCLASAGSDGSIHIWDATNGNTLLVHRITEGKALRAIAWSPNGRRLAVACSNGDVQVWPISLNSEIMPD